MQVLSVIASTVIKQNLFGLFSHPKDEANQKSTDKIVTRGHLVMGDRIVGIYNGPHGRFYSVSSEGGTRVDEDLSEDKLQNHYPDIYQQIHLYLAMI